MNRSKLFVAAIFASACITTLDGLPPNEGAAGAGSTSAPSAGSSSTTGGLGGTEPNGGSANAGSPGASAAGNASGGMAGAGVGASAGSSGNGNASGTGSAGLAGMGATAGTGVAGGGSTNGGAGGSSAVTFAPVRDLIIASCARTDCHDGRENPNLANANLYTTLMNTAVRECGNDRLVAAGDPANSAILELVNGQCGDLIMPETCDAPPCFTAAELALVSSWISAGAPP